MRVSGIAISTGRCTYSKVFPSAAPSRLILSVSTHCPVLPHLLATAFCSDLHHIILHPTMLLRHISAAFLLNPPPLTPTPKWWSVFGPFSARERGEAELLYFSPRYKSDVVTMGDEVVVELFSRSTGAKGAVRVLEGWSPSKGPCNLEELEELKSVFANKKVLVPVRTSLGAFLTLMLNKSVDPTQNLPFNILLTAPQEIARSQVVLPYVHEGEWMVGLRDMWNKP
jgi:elongator complex protein 5